jgi:lysophospholipase L1-like esterase
MSKQGTRKGNRRHHWRKEIGMNGPSAIRTASDSMVVACLGESLTKGGAVSYDWVGDLESRPQNAAIPIRFVNLGVGGDPSYSALKRLPQVIECRPDKVVVLTGSSDVVNAIDPTMRRAIGTWKRLPQKPSLERFEENVRQIVRGLKNETTARVALCSLPVIGEDPESEANRRLGEYSAIIKQITREESVSYIPFYEHMHEQIVASPGRAFTGSIFLSMCRAAFRIYVLRKSLDEVGKQSGWRFHVDGVHLGSRGGKILADLVQEFVAA